MVKSFNLKDQLAGIAALIAAIVAIGGGFVKYGEITTKLDAIEAREQVVVDTSHSHDFVEHKHDLVEHKHDLVEHDHPVEHSHTKPLVNAKEIELLKVQIEEIKVSTKNPLSN